jgi:hypothetical protein
MSEWFGPWGEPSISCLYGDAGLGKSTDLARACCTGIIFAPPAGVKPALTVYGFKPHVIPVSTVEEVMQAILWAKSAYPHILRHGIDDFSVIAQSSYKRIEAQVSNVQRRFAENYRVMTDFREVVKAAGVDIVLTAHVQPPYVEERTNVFEKGGPRLPSKPLTPLLPYVCDNAFLVEPDPGRKPHPARFNVDIEGKYLVKDRDNSIPMYSPVNLAEAKRAAGYLYPRLAGLEWQDDAAAEVFDIIAADMTKRPSAIAAVAQKYLDRGHDIRHVQWAVYDGADRAEIRVHKRAEQMAVLGLGKSPFVRTGAGFGLSLPQQTAQPSSQQTAQPSTASPFKLKE